MNEIRHGKESSIAKGTDQHLLRNLAIAAGVAVFGVILVVLPAEYGVDPFGFGRLTGLSDLSHDHATHTDELPPPAVSGHAHVQVTPYKTDTIRIELEDLGEVEHKLLLPENGTVVYSWKIEGDTANGGVFFDFHGHPTKDNRAEFPDDFEISYSTGEQPAHSAGFVAPFAGLHGWYFLNLEERPVTIVIDVAGYYTEHLELYRSVAGDVITAIDY